MAINVYFDLDMTLVYRIIMWTGTVQELLLEECVVTREEDIKPFWEDGGYPWCYPELSHEEFFKGEGFWEHIEKYIVCGLLERNITSEDIATRVAKRFKDKFLEPSYWRVFGDTIPTINKLKTNGYGVHLISNNIPECRDILAFLGITDLFDSLTLSYEIGYEKPNRKIFEAALSGHKKDINIMVGDNYNADILGAKGAGMLAIMVRKPNTMGYKYYLPDLSNLDSMIEEVINNEIR